MITVRAGKVVTDVQVTFDFGTHSVACKMTDCDITQAEKYLFDKINQTPIIPTSWFSSCSKSGFIVATNAHVIEIELGKMKRVSEYILPDNRVVGIVELYKIVIDTVRNARLKPTDEVLTIILPDSPPRVQTLESVEKKYRLLRH